MPAAGPQNTRKRQLRRPKPRTGGGPQGNGRITAPKPRPAPKVRPPSQTQVRQARAQARTYKSQGVSVRKDAKAKGRSQKIRRQTEKIHGDHPQTDAQRAASTPGLQVDPKVYAKLEAHDKQAALIRAKRLAPALTVLDQTTRPLHAVAAAAKEDVKDIKRRGVAALIDPRINPKALKAAGQGIQNKDRSTFSDVLKEAGVKNKLVRSVGGFALDVGLDPLTHGRGGAASSAEVTARSAARGAERDAVKSGTARAAGDKAAAQAAKHGESAKAARKAAEAKHIRRQGKAAGDVAAAGKQTNKGINIQFAGHDVPGVARGTAAIKRAPRKVAEKTGAQSTRVGRKIDRAQQTVRDTTRNVASDFNPAIAPAGVDRELYQSARRSARTARAGAQRGTHKAGQRAIAFRDGIGEKNYATVIDAIETGQIHTLDPKLRQGARELEREFARMRKAERRAGINTPRRENYVHHLRLKDDAVKDPVRKGGRNPQAGYTKKRLEGTIAEKNAAQPGAYSEDIADIALNRGAKSAVDIAKAKANQALVKAGRKPDRAVPLKDQIGADEALYKIDGARIAKVDPKDAGKITNQHVILNEKLVARTRGTVGTAAERSTTGVFFDKAQGVWKIAATQVNPGYHVRNLFGEAHNAYLKENPVVLGKNAVEAAKALRQLGRNEDADRVLGKTAKGAGSERDRFIREAESVGAVRAGQLGRDVKRQLAGESKKAGPLTTKRRALLRKPARGLQNIEDVFRLATYKGGRDRGLSPEKAMGRAAENHFDYGDLTTLEREKLTRVMPFYTFSARNIPLQMKTVVTNPGKFAQYQKVREEVAKAFGLDTRQEEGKSPEREQRSVPVFVKIGGKTFGISLGPSGLPLTDLNEFPTTANPVKQADEWMQRAMSLVTPAAKTPVELWSNMSFFFRDQIERDEGPLAPAPSWVKHIPAKYRKDLGIVSDYRDSRSGKKTWAAPAKVVYALSVLPGPVNFANRVQTPSERAGQDTKSKIIGYVGIRAIPVDERSTAIENLYTERQNIRKKSAALRQRGISAANATPQYRYLLDREKEITSHIFALKNKRGDVIKNPGRKPSVGSADKPSGVSGGFFKSHERPSTTSGTPGQGFFK